MATGAGSRCAADSACSELFEQQNLDSHSGTPQLIHFCGLLEQHISSVSKSFFFVEHKLQMFEHLEHFCYLGGIHTMVII